MRALSVCVVLCCALAFASAAKPGPALFSDWLEEQTTVAGPASTAKPAAASSPAYEEADYEWGCFSEKKWGNCRAIGCTDYCANQDCDIAPACWSTYYYESTLACCEESGYDDYERDAPPSLMTNIEIGTCEITEFDFGVNNTVPVAGTTDIAKLGTFQAVCNLHRGGQCNHPFCDSMVLSWKGTAYRTPAVSKTNPMAPESDCEHAFLDFTQVRRGGGRTKARKADAGEVAYRGDRDSEPETPTTYFKGTALILSGPATVSSRKYNLKYSTGFIDYAKVWAPDVNPSNGNAITVTAAEAAYSHMVKPYTYTVRLTKDGHY